MKLSTAVIPALSTFLSENALGERGGECVREKGKDTIFPE